jgi:hypothetical protein
MYDMSNTAAPSTTDFTLRFGGATVELDVRTFLGSLLGVSTILTEVNSTLAPDTRLELKVKALKPGSFLVHLELLTPGLAALPLITPDAIKLLKEAVGFLADLLSLRKHLKKEEPKAIQQIEGEVVITNSADVTIKVDRRVFNLYGSNPTVNQSLDRTFEALADDPAVSTFEVRDQTDRPLFRADRDEFGELIGGRLLAPAQARVQRETARLNIVKVSFEKKLKWDFVYLGHRISAYVTDADFLEKVNAGAETFTKGDLLEAELEIRQVYDPPLQTYLNAEYRVLRVIRHIRAGHQTSLLEE